MDDKNFDPLSADNWISTIEDPSAIIRNTDIYPKVLNWVNETYAKNVIDIGCGQGDCSQLFDKMNLNYTGIDPSAHLLNRAKQIYTSPNKAFVMGNIYSLPFEENSFDCAFSVSVWHLLSDIHKASLELSRVLKKGRYFLIITANPDAYHLWTSNYVDSSVIGKRYEGKTKNGHQDILHLHSKNEIIDALKSSNLKVDQTNTFRDVSNSEKMYIAIKGEKI